MSAEAVEWASGQTVDAPSHKLILLLLANHLNRQTGQCNPSIGRLEQQSCLSTRGVRDALRALERAKLIVTDRGPRRACRFRLLMPAASSSSSDQSAEAQAPEPSPSPAVTADRDQAFPAVSADILQEGPALTAGEAEAFRQQLPVRPAVTAPRKGREQEEGERKREADPFDMLGATVSGGKQDKRRKPAIPIIPDWMPPKAWNGYIEMRKAKRAEPTARAVELLIAKLDEWRERGVDIEDALNRSIMSNWTDVYEPKSDRFAGRTTETPASRLEDIERIRQQRRARGFA